MALQIYKGEARATRVFEKAKFFHGQCKWDVQMGGFAAAKNTDHSTALSTTGAGPCQIIVVHKKAGCGALGHYAGTSEPEKIAEGVEAMVRELGGNPVGNVIFAAGRVQSEMMKQFRYQIAIINQVSAICQSAEVVWPAYDEEEDWSACYYLPLDEILALGVDGKCPGGLYGTGHVNHGITTHSFGPKEKKGATSDTAAGQ